MTHAIAKCASRTRSRRPAGVVMTTYDTDALISILLWSRIDFSFIRLAIQYYEIAKIRTGLLIGTQSGYAYVFPEVAVGRNVISKRDKSLVFMGCPMCRCRFEKILITNVLSFTRGGRGMSTLRAILSSNYPVRTGGSCDTTTTVGVMTRQLPP
jgi:hypothetical protein